METIKPHQFASIKGAILMDARRIRATGAECPPALFLINRKPNGDFGTVTCLTIAHLQKDEIAALHRKQSRDPSIAAAILMQECWQSLILPGQDIPANGSTANNPLRQEMLLLNMLTATEQWLLAAEIHGNTIETAEWQEVTAENYKGRFIRERTT